MPVMVDGNKASLETVNAGIEAVDFEIITRR